MKTFLYRLESVLNLRARAEEQAREIYARALHARAGCEAALREARGTLEAYHAALHSAREGVSDRQSQLIFLNALQHQQAQCNRMAEQLTAAEREVAARREAMLVARREREVLSRLKLRQQSAHSAEAARAEESMIGDLISARHAMSLQEVAA